MLFRSLPILLFLVSFFLHLVITLAKNTSSKPYATLVSHHTNVHLHIPSDHNLHAINYSTYYRRPPELYAHLFRNQYHLSNRTYVTTKHDPTNLTSSSQFNIRMCVTNIRTYVLAITLRTCTKNSCTSEEPSEEMSQEHNSCTRMSGRVWPFFLPYHFARPVCCH